MFYCIQKPPSTLEINGSVYKIETDFFIWAVYFEDFLYQIEENADNEQVIREIVERIKQTFFLKPINEALEDVIKAMITFYEGYPKNAYKEELDSNHDNLEDEGIYFNENERTLDFKVDLNLLLVAIRNQSGLDLTHRGKDVLHWWDFLLEVQSLIDEHKISQIRGYRAYKGEDKELRRIKDYYKLSQRLSKKQKEVLEEIDELFYNS